MTMTEKEMRWAQQDIVKGSRSIADAGMRLRGTKYESDYKRLWDALTALNNRLINDIRGGQ